VYASRLLELAHNKISKRTFSLSPPLYVDVQVLAEGFAKDNLDILVPAFCRSPMISLNLSCFVKYSRVPLRILCAVKRSLEITSFSISLNLKMFHECRECCIYNWTVTEDGKESRFLFFAMRL
jgi:hypothetical protein